MPGHLSSLRVSQANELEGSESRSFLATNVEEIDSVCGGIPRGAITNLFGSPSCGKTTFINRFLSSSTRSGEFCALIDATKNFDPAVAKASGVALSRLFWVQCEAPNNKQALEQAIKCTDLLIHSGGWGVVVLDLSDIAPEWVRRLPLSYWYRFRRAIQTTPACLLVVEREPNVKSCASLSLEFQRRTPIWNGIHRDFRTLDTVEYAAVPKKPARQEQPRFRARALA